jgi:hypothetical protein
MTQGPTTSHGVPADDELLTPAVAAVIASRSTRTIRRAYRTGRLVAYRDGNGRGVHIRYGDLRQWMTASSAIGCDEEGGATEVVIPLRRLDGQTGAGRAGEYLDLLNAARTRQRRGGALGDADGRRVGGRRASQWA